jgi:glutathione S-transferase
MKLYFSPGACSMSPHIVLAEAGLAYTTEQVDLRAKRTAGGADFRTINPKGYVPALETTDGTVLTEGPAIVQYIADMVPEKKLAPPFGTFERYQMMELLNFISSEIHKNYGPLFKPDASEDMKTAARANLTTRFAYIATTLDGHDYLTGSRFTVADAYLFTVLNWAPVVRFDLSLWPALTAFHARVAARPAVQQVMRDEGLLK